LGQIKPRRGTGLPAQAQVAAWARPRARAREELALLGRVKQALLGRVKQVSLIQQRLRKKKRERAEASWAEMNACWFGPNEKENSFFNFYFSRNIVNAFWIFSFEF
jgi:hypothetical protein